MMCIKRMYTNMINMYMSMSHTVLSVHTPLHLQMIMNQSETDNMKSLNNITSNDERKSDGSSGNL
jgi:hypothetical protein